MPAKNRSSTPPSSRTTERGTEHGTDKLVILNASEARSFEYLQYTRETLVHIQEIKLTDGGSKSNGKYYVVVRADTIEVGRTAERRVEESLVLWNKPNIAMRLKGPEWVELLVFQRQALIFKRILGTVETRALDFMQNTTEIQRIVVLRNPKGIPNFTLTVQFENEMSTVANEILKGPTELEAGNDTLEKFLDSIEVSAKILDEIAKVHPIAAGAWLFISSAYQVLKAQQDKDNAIRDLYKIMMATLKVASRKDILKQREEFEDHFKDMINLSIECSLFIAGYTSGLYYQRMAALDVSRKISRFKESFLVLEKGLTLRMGRETIKTVLEIRDKVDRLMINSIREGLKPGEGLGARDSGMPGTRKLTLSKTAKWISCGTEPILWLFGIVGTGKSSIMGSLLEICDKHTTRLAAFIRFDRALFSDASLFVRALAYQLAAFDSRLGHAISNAFLDRPQIINSSLLSEQFDVLIREPLQKYPELHSEGPIVVLIDGLDECGHDAWRKQLLNLLSNSDASFKRLPFLRIIVSSRPEEDILRIFRGCTHIHPFQLDTASPETKADIAYFITNKLNESKSTEFQALCEEKNAVSELSMRASGLFIWAAVAVAFISDLPHQRLELVLETDIPPSALIALDTLYQTALNSVVKDITAEDIQSTTRVTLRVIMIFSRLGPSSGHLTEPLLISLLAYLHMKHMKDFLDKLRSIMITFDNNTNRVQLMHKSLDDFLTNKARCGESWYISLANHDSDAVSMCLSGLFALFEDHTNAVWNSGCPPIATFASTAIYQVITRHIESIPSGSILYEKFHQLFSIYLLRSWTVFGGSLRILSDHLKRKIVEPTLAFQRLLDQSNSFLQYCDRCEKSGRSNEEIPFKMFQWLRQQQSGPLAKHYLPGYHRLAGDLTSYDSIRRAFLKSPIPLGQEVPHPDDTGVTEWLYYLESDSRWGLK